MADLQRGRRLAGGLFRMGISTIFLAWAIYSGMSSPALLAPMVAYLVLSVIFLAIYRLEGFFTFRVAVYCVLDVVYVTYCSYLIGIDGSPMAVFYVLVLLAYLLHVGYWGGIIVIVLSVSSYLVLLVLRNKGILPPGPLEDAKMGCEHFGGSGRGQAFLSALLITLLGTFALVSFTLKRIRGFIDNESDLLKSRHRADRHSEALQERLEETARLEGLGRLAGGVAHDFNNLLSVILGYGRELRDEMPLDDPRREDLSEMVSAAEQAEELTRGLLAFSRRQVVSKVVTDPNSLISAMSKILDRLIGEDVHLETRLDADVGRIEVDPSGLEQVVMNLVVNARDAMPGGGRVIISTTTVELSPADCVGRADVEPGRYVEISVSDEGVGMDMATADKVFEPFFTTKSMGEGTGLGLSMVYGIVRQHGGHVELTTAPGEGSRFDVRLPLCPEEPEARDSRPSLMPWEGNETILLVEDEPSVRKATKWLLRNTEHRILEAGSGEEALKVARAYEGEIHLLLTDVVMPGMSGKELADQLRITRPDVRVLFMSGYSDEALGKKGLLSKDPAFIAKPIDARKLRSKINKIFDAEERGLPGDHR